MTEPERYAVVNGWLVENMGRHTCGAGTVESGYAHEPGCGWEPIARVEQLLAGPADADANAAWEAYQDREWHGWDLGSASTDLREAFLAGWVAVPRRRNAS